MRKIIKENELRNIIKKYISEALKYDKERRQYFPDYTGDTHSDAGKFVSNNRDDFNFTRNDYQWSDPKKQQRFQDLQLDNDVEINPTDPDGENENGAYKYLQDHEPDRVVDDAAEAMRGEFENMIGNFIKKATQQYPVLNNNYYMSSFIYHLRDYLNEYDY